MVIKLQDVSKKIFSAPITLRYGKTHRGWVVPRDKTFDLIPRLSYEDGCDVVIDGIPAKARLTILFRLFYSRHKEKDLAEYLDSLTLENDAEIDMKILIKDDEFLEFSSSADVCSLNQKFIEYRKSSEEMKNYLVGLNKELSDKITTLNDEIEVLKKDNYDLSNYIGDLEEKNNILEKRLKYLSNK